jgi:membrane protein
MQRLISFGLVVAIGFLLLVALAVSAALSALADWINARAPGLPLLWAAIDMVLSISVITALFAILYRVLPDVKLRWSDVWAGAAATALLFTIGKFLIGLYLGRSSTTSSYGAAGSVVIVLLWVYYTSQVVLLGAEFTRVYTRRERSKPQPADWAERCAGPGRRAV